MSHFSRIKTSFTNRDALVRCLTDLGLSVEQNTAIRGYRGLQNVEIAARSSDGGEIGFLQNRDGSFDMVADWWTKKGNKGDGGQQLIRELNQLAGKVQQEYARRILLEQAKNDGFSVVEEQYGEDGSIRIVVRRWVP